MKVVILAISWKKFRGRALVSLARPSLKERGSGQTAIVELYR